MDYRDFNRCDRWLTLTIKSLVLIFMLTYSAIKISEAVNEIHGDQTETAQLSADEEKIIAAHEAGHAVVAWYASAARRPISASIVPNKMNLGHTALAPQRRLSTAAAYRAEIAVYLAGRIAEERLLDEPADGSRSDLKYATDIAAKMVKEYGMSQLGLVYYTNGDLGSIASDAIDEAVSNIIRECREDAEAILKRRITELSKVRSALIEKRALSAADLENILGVRPISK